ncbi:hypothetical protein SUGI_1177270 [Cryptomeria japonica]|nr:hypothetical protein SUGI_1177270 [Cryptomeria japonica]
MIDERIKPHRYNMIGEVAMRCLIKETSGIYRRLQVRRSHEKNDSSPGYYANRLRERKVGSEIGERVIRVRVIP